MSTKLKTVDICTLLAGMLQKQHPDIALSIKTRQAIRSVLNNLRDGVHELLMDGILEEAEGTKLEKVSTDWPLLELLAYGTMLKKG